MNNVFLGHEWGDLPIIFITSDPKIVIHANECIILFLTCYFTSLNAQLHQKQSSVTDLAIAAKDTLFLFSIVTSLQFICDVMRTRVTGIVT